MRSKLIGLGLLFILSLATPMGFAQKVQSTYKDQIVVVKVRGDDLKDSRKIREWEQFLKALETQQPEAILFDLNLKGDLPWESQEKILESLSQLTVPTISYVNSSATGAGALIAVGSDTIYLSQTGIVGGAGVQLGDIKNEEAQKRQLAQQLSLLKARARSIAKSKGHRVDVVEAFIDSDIEIKYGEDLISKKGDILTLTATEAVKEYDGKPVLAKGVATSIDAIIKAEGLSKGKDEFKPVSISPTEFTRKRNQDRLKTKSSTTTDDADVAEEDDKGLFSKSDGDSYQGKIVIIKVGQRDLATGKARFEFMQRTLKKAQEDKAEAVIFDIDTPGGYAWYTEGLILKSLQNTQIPTYSFVNSRAYSAGAIIALGTDTIYMRPAATIGSALVVSGAGGDLNSSMESKITQGMISVVRNIAEIKGHNPDIAEAFVTRKKEVKIAGTVIHEVGEVLNLNTLRATEEIGGRPVLAKGVADSLDDLIAQEGLKGERAMAVSMGMESFAHWVQKFSALLLVIGIAGVYMEIKSPGFALPGAIGLLAFGIYFFGHNMAGKLAGYELAVVFVLGLILICVEIFLFPGVIVPALVGSLMVIGSLIFAVVDRGDFELKKTKSFEAPGWGDILKEGVLTTSLGLLGSVALILVLMKFLPKSKVGNMLVLDEAVPAGASIDGQIAVDTDNYSRERESYLGWEGESVTDLRPAGKGRFKGKLFDIIADGEYINKGTLIKVIKHEGSRIVVRPIDS